MRRVLVPVLAIAVSTAVAVMPFLATAQTPPTFTETFDGTPTSPTQYYPTTGGMPWDIVLKGFDSRETSPTVSGGDSRGANIAAHGTDCAAPPNGTAYDSSNADTHQMSDQLDMVFQCNGHMMMSPGMSGYGAIYANPPSMMDFSSGTSTFSWDMSTLHTAAREWVDVVLTPFNQYEPLAYISTIEHIPADNIRVEFGDGPASIAVYQYANGTKSSVSGDSASVWDTYLATYGLSESAVRRDHFRISLSSTHIQVCITANTTGAVEHCYFDTNLPSSLGSAWNGGYATVQLNTKTYNAEKSCNEDPPATTPWTDSFGINHSGYGDAHCPPNTWHFDNVSISPASNYTVILPNGTFPLTVSGNGPNTITFPTAAPSNSLLEFTCFCNHNFNTASGAQEQIRTSTDGGSTYTSWANVTWVDGEAHDDIGNQALISIPTGTNAVQLQGTSSWFSPSDVTYIAIRSSTAITINTPTPTPTPAATNTPTPTPVATNTPTATPTATATPTPGGASFTHYQTTSESAVSNAASVSLSSVGSSRLLVLAVSLGDATTTVSSISDSAGTTYTLKGSEVANGLSTLLYAATGAASGTHSVTVNLSGSVGHQVYLSEYGSTTTVTDDGTGTGATGTGTGPASGAYTTTGTNDLVVAIHRYGSSQSPVSTEGNGWVSGGTTQSRSIYEDRLNAAAGTYNGDASIPTSSTWNALLFAFKD